MNVLHLVSDTDRRGAQVFATQLAEALGGLGIGSTVAALTRGTGDSPLDLPVLAHGWRARRRALRSHDLVIAHGSTTLDACAATIPGRFVYRSIGDPRFWLASPARRLKTGALYRTARAVVVLYPDAADALTTLVKLPRSRLAVIPNAVTPPPGTIGALPRLTPASRHVLSVGALSWEKQIDHLVAAVFELDDTGLVVVGDGPERQRLITAASTLGDRVHFAGAVSDPWPYYRACDVLGLTSRTEGIPGCVLEAALTRTPACAYAVGGLGETIIEGVTGRVVPAGDVHALSAALEAAFDHGVEWGRAASQHVADRFSMTSVAAAWADLIEQTLSQR